MADIAVIFGWRPQDMDDWSPEELAAWHDRARRRSPAGAGDE